MQEQQTTAQQPRQIGGRHIRCNCRAAAGSGKIYMGQNLRFMATPVRAGDTVHVTVTVKELIPEKCRVRLTTVCTVDGEIVIDGDALVVTTSQVLHKGGICTPDLGGKASTGDFTQSIIGRLGG